MADPEPDHNLRESVSELECLVDVRKNLDNSNMNFEPVNDTITQKPVGLGALGENDLRGIRTISRHTQHHHRAPDLFNPKS